MRNFLFKRQLTVFRADDERWMDLMQGHPGARSQPEMYELVHP